MLHPRIAGGASKKDEDEEEEVEEEKEDAGVPVDVHAEHAPDSTTLKLGYSWE